MHPVIISKNSDVFFLIQVSIIVYLFEVIRAFTKMDHIQHNTLLIL